MKYVTFPYDTVELFRKRSLDFTYKVGIRIPVALFSAQIRFVLRFSNNISIIELFESEFVIYC